MVLVQLQVSLSTTTVSSTDAIYGPDTIEVDSDSASSLHGEDYIWPQFTNIVHVPGRELSLGHQYFEVKLVVRKAMDLILERLLFNNGFPSLALRAIWSRRSFIDACSILETSVGSHAQLRYYQLLQRFKSDAPYVRELSRLVCTSIV